MVNLKFFLFLFFVLNITCTHIHIPLYREIPETLHVYICSYNCNNFIKEQNFYKHQVFNLYTYIVPQ